jgi:hypothetical protein
MANFPTSLDTLTNPTSGNTLDSPSHSVQHSDANDILEALEAKVGIGTSTAGSATAGHALVASTGGTTSWTTIGTAGITSGSATNGQVLTANGSGAVTFNTPSQGLTLINTTSFSGLNSQSINNVFSASYDIYKIVIVAVSSTGNSIYMRLRAAGTDNTTASSYLGQNVQGVTTTASAGTDTESFWILYNGNTSRSIASVDIANPFLATTTVLTGTVGRTDRVRSIFAHHNQSTSYDGFTLFQDGVTTITGYLQVFGYNK